MYFQTTNCTPLIVTGRVGPRTASAQSCRGGNRLCVISGVIGLPPQLVATGWQRKERLPSSTLLSAFRCHSLWFWLRSGHEGGQEVFFCLLLLCSISYAEKVPEKQFDFHSAHSISHRSWQKPQLEPIQVWLGKPRGRVVRGPTGAAWFVRFWFSPSTEAPSGFPSCFAGFPLSPRKVKLSSPPPWQLVAFSVESRLARTERPKLQKMNLPMPEARDQVLVLNINYTQAGRFR